MEKEAGTRQPHAVLDLPSRRWKAMKIERLLNLTGKSELRLLEVGTGSGGIAHFFGTQTDGRYIVDAVDIHDNRLVSEGYRYVTVQDTYLPFDSESFDVVLTNHVIEHVGDKAEQRLHLREVRRVLKPGGVGYLAVPNRWMLFEPHFRVPFLSWLPRAWRTPYLKATGKGERYDCEPLEMRELESLFEEAGLCYRNKCIDALRATFEIEREDALTSHLLKCIPDWVLRPTLPIIPTLIYRFWHESNADGCE